MIKPEDADAPNESAEDSPYYTPRGNFLIELAQEALSCSMRRKLEKEIAVLRSALKVHENRPTTRLAKQLKNRLDTLKNELNNIP